MGLYTVGICGTSHCCRSVPTISTLGRDGTAGLWYSVGMCGTSPCSPGVPMVHLDRMVLQDCGVALVNAVHPIAILKY